MTLFDIIRDFFVQYVFGGTDSTNNMWFNAIGSVIFDDNGTASGGPEDTASLLFPIGKLFGGITGTPYPTNAYISLGDWLSTTATIISLVGLFIAIVFLLIKLFRFVSNLFLLR